tara:strand:+ start:150 stop:371 length:222 start_codon:yes stop_codon:yes gene_type:complete
MSENKVAIQNVVVNDKTVNPLIQHFFNKAYSAGILSLAEASKMYELVEYLNKKSMEKNVQKLNKVELEISEKN